SGVGVPKDYTKAIGWYELAAHQGHMSASKNLRILKNEIQKSTARISAAKLAALKKQMNVTQPASATKLAALKKQMNVTQPASATPSVFNTNPAANFQYDLDKLNRRLDDAEFERQQREFNESVRRNEEAYQRQQEQAQRALEESMRHIRERY
ncbi:SEL1-like repeat protein, partial [bacterium]|nr:SEL1-like repeat protein [bacterium]